MHADGAACMWRAAQAGRAQAGYARSPLALIHPARLHSVVLPKALPTMWACCSGDGGGGRPWFLRGARCGESGGIVCMRACMSARTRY